MLKPVTLIVLGAFIVSESVIGDELSSDKIDTAVCSSCHSVDGNSSRPSIPNLANQDAEYIVKQLRAFKSGSRNSDIMKGVIQGMVDSEMVEFATFFSAQEITKPNGAANGSAEGKLQYSACWGCHGEYGEGAQGYPRIAGQYSQYISTQLKNFRSGSRKSPVMEAIAVNLSNEDMLALGDYLESLSPK